METSPGPLMAEWVQSGDGDRRLPRGRPLIAFFDYCDVFEDFYPHYGVDQRNFATRWAATGSHAFVSVLQRDVGDVIWYAFSLAPQLSEAQHELTGCRVKILPSSWLHRRLWRLFYLPPAAWRWRRAYPAYATVASYLALASRSFLATIRRDRPDFIFLQDYSSGRFDVLLAVARVLGAQLIAYHSGSRPDHYLGRAVKRWTIRRADRLVVSSQEEREMLIQRFRVAPERISVTLTPIDTSVFRQLGRAMATRLAGLDPDRRYILFVGRLDDPVKRVSALIRSLAGLAAVHPDVDLLVAGEGPDGQGLRRLAAELAPGRVRFLGWMTGAEPLAALYNSAECLVLPSRSEGFPTVVGEAMACGTPVLASSVGGVGELVVDGRTGWLFPPGDDAALGARLAFALEHPDVTARMRPAARRIAEARVSAEAVAVELRRCFLGRGSG